MAASLVARRWDRRRVLKAAFTVSIRWLSGQIVFTIPPGDPVALP